MGLGPFSMNLIQRRAGYCKCVNTAPTLIFVALANSINGEVLISRDSGNNWVRATTEQEGDWVSLAYGNGIFVAVSIDGKAMRSIDGGKNWLYSTTSQNGIWSSVAYGNGIFVAVSSDGKAMRSLNGGNNWLYSTTNPVGQYSSVAYGDGVFIAVGGLYSAHTSYRNIAKSTDEGVSWSSVTFPGFYPDDIAYGEGVFVAMSNLQDGVIEVAIRSTNDGSNWELSTTTNETTYEGFSELLFFSAVAAGY